MKPTCGYTIVSIDDTPYLLPYGQKIAENRRGIRLNESGAKIWECLPAKNEEILKKIQPLYPDSPSVDVMEQDVDRFLSQLKTWGFVNEKQEPKDSQDDLPIRLKIGGLAVWLQGMESALLHDSLKAFICKDKSIEKNLRIDFQAVSGVEGLETGGRLLIHTHEITICEKDDRFLLFSDLLAPIQQIRLNRDGTYACVEYLPSNPERLTESFYHAIRFIYLYAAQCHDKFAIHSASVLYHGKAWLFAGSSGTGKSTHTSLWNQFFDAPVLNGDLNLIGIKDSSVYVYGLPWCGTSGIFHTKTYPLGGIVHLKQSTQNACQTLTKAEQILFTAQRMISPTWEKEMLQRNLAFCEQLCENVLNVRLFCTKERESAELMKQKIDEWEQNREA